jgi:hypothetical protein
MRPEPVSAWETGPKRGLLAERLSARKQSRFDLFRGENRRLEDGEHLNETRARSHSVLTNSEDSVRAPDKMQAALARNSGASERRDGMDTGAEEAPSDAGEQHAEAGLGGREPSWGGGARLSW